MLSESSIHASENVYIKVPGCVGLYRHTKSGRYYGVKKVHGRRRERSLETNDRKIAERRLKEWIDDLLRVDSEAEKTTLKVINQKYIAVNRGKAESTQKATQAIIREFESWWPLGLNFQVRNIRPSHLEEWLALHERRLKNTSYNRYAGVLKGIFELAVKDRIIASSPFLQVATRWKKPQKPKRCIPTVEQFEAIVNDIRSQRFSSHADGTADFVAFLGLAGLGQAEASSLTWGDVDFARGCIHIRRHKTDTRFVVPIYPHLRVLMDQLRAKAGKTIVLGERVFLIRDAKKALTAACNRLGYVHFSQRNLRQCLIMRLWRAGIDKKLIARYQGHTDGGELISSTYTEVFGDDDGAYEQMQLAKLEPVAMVPSSNRFLAEAGIRLTQGNDQSELKTA